MTQQDTSGYQVLLTRARRQFALCVVEGQEVMMTAHQLRDPNAIAWVIVREFRRKADQLQRAIQAAEAQVTAGNVPTACVILTKENNAI